MVKEDVRRPTVRLLGNCNSAIPWSSTVIPSLLIVFRLQSYGLELPSHFYSVIPVSDFLALIFGSLSTIA
jgi:hypothetical protein